MAAGTRQHLNGFIAGARLIGAWLADELRELAGRSATFTPTGRGVNHIEEAQVLAGQTLGNARIAHNRGRFERRIDLSYAPFGNVLTFPPEGNGAAIASGNAYSVPRGVFVAGSVRFNRAGRIDGATVFVTSAIGLRVGEDNLPGLPDAADDLSDWPDAEITLDLRLIRSGAELHAERMDDPRDIDTINHMDDVYEPGSLSDYTHAFTSAFKVPGLTVVQEAPVIAGPIRLSTRPDERPDPSAKPGVPVQLPLSISDFAEGDVVVAVISTPRMMQIMLGNGSGSWVGSKCVVRDPTTELDDYRAFEATSVGPAHIAFDVSYEAQP